MGVGLVGLGWVRREGEMGRLGLTWFLWDRPAKPVALAALTGGGWWPQTTANSAAYARGAGDESGIRASSHRFMTHSLQEGRPGSAMNW